MGVCVGGGGGGKGGGGRSSNDISLIFVVVVVGQTGTVKTAFFSKGDFGHFPIRKAHPRRIPKPVTQNSSIRKH